MFSFVGTSDASSVAKPTEASAAQRSTRDVPKAPTSQPAAISSESGAHMTPAKGKFALFLCERATMGTHDFNAFCACLV